MLEYTSDYIKALSNSNRTFLSELKQLHLPEAFIDKNIYSPGTISRTE